MTDRFYKFCCDQALKPDFEHHWTGLYRSGHTIVTNNNLTPCTLYVFFSDPVGNGTTSSKKWGPTPVDDLVAVSTGLFTGVRSLWICLGNLHQLNKAFA